MPTVLFICPHGAGKSRLAAAFFDRVAPPGWRATSAGPEPDPAVSAAAVRLLDGTGAATYLDRAPPRPLAAVASPAYTVAIDCAVPADEHWSLSQPHLGEAMRDELRARAAALARGLARRGEGRDMAAHAEDSSTGSAAPVGLAPLVRYFLGLGTWGFGGPAALIGFMHRDLVERRRWVDEETYRLALALAQLMPGPLAAQTAIALGYFHRGVLGATLVGLAFILPSFLMVVALAALYVAYGGLWWMQAAFYGVGAAVIAIIAVAAYKLARSTNRRDPLLWAVFAATAVVTTWAQAELAEAFLLAGLVALLAKAPPRWLTDRLPRLSHGLAPLALPALPLALASAEPGADLLWQILLYFAKAGAFVFGSGLAIVPFLYGGVVREFGWLTDQQFLDAVAVAMLTPGPVVITVAFIGYLVAGLPGAIAAAAGIFLPVYLLTIVPAPWFKRHRDHPQLKAFVLGATAAATGAIAGAVVVLGLRTLVDAPTVLIALVSLGLLWRFKLPEPALVVAAGLVGLILWPLARPGA